MNTGNKHAIVLPSRLTMLFQIRSLQLFLAVVAMGSSLGCENHSQAQANQANSKETSSRKLAVPISAKESQIRSKQSGYANPAPRPSGFRARHTDAYSPVQHRLYEALGSGDMARIRDEAEATRAWIRENRPSLEEDMLLICGVVLNDSKFERERRQLRSNSNRPQESFNELNLGSAAWFADDPRQYLSSLLREAKESSLKIFLSLQGTLSEQELRELALLLLMNKSGALHPGMFVELYSRFRSERFHELSQYLYAKALYCREHYELAIEVAGPLQ